MWYSVRYRSWFTLLVQNHFWFSMWFWVLSFSSLSASVALGLRKPIRRNGTKLKPLQNQKSFSHQQCEPASMSYTTSFPYFNFFQKYLFQNICIYKNLIVVRCFISFLQLIYYSSLLFVTIYSWRLYWLSIFVLFFICFFSI